MKWKWFDTSKKDYSDQLYSQRENNDDVMMDELNFEGKVVEQTYLKNIWPNLSLLHIPIAYVDFEEEEKIIISEKVQEILNTDDKKISIEHFKKIVHPEDINKVLNIWNEIKVKEKIKNTFRLVTEDNVIKWMNCTCTRINKANGMLHGMIIFFEEITKLKNLQENINYLVTHDDLTNLPNFYYGKKYLRMLTQELKGTNKNFGFFILNIDDFSRIPHTLGLTIADEVIKQISLRLFDYLGKSSILFRIQGDEWGIVIQGNQIVENYSKIAEGIIKIIQEPLSIEEYVIQVTASIGISIFPNDAESNEQLFINAHTALKHAKQLGTGTFQHYSAKMTIESFKRFKLEQKLRKVVENNELYVEYQPKIDLQTNKVTSAEAFIRWNHPVWGNVSPAEFIPIAENMGIYHEITNQVIQTVCWQISEWEQKGIEFEYISFNLSARDFRHKMLIKRIHDAVKKYDIDPSRLQVELTEDVLLEKDSFIQEQFLKLKDLGIKFALDDFGTGYSPIRFVKELPVDTVKIDRSFIQELPHNKQDMVIVKSIIELSKRLGKIVIAEGVETVEQLQVLRQLGCHKVQGYLFSHSVKPEKMIEWFQADKVEHCIQKNVKVERRKYYRQKLPFPLSANMTIVSFNGMIVSLGSTEVLVANIGLGGLCFLSHLRLTPQEKMIFQFTTELLGQEVQLNGRIVWYRELTDSIFEYGVSFVINESERDELAAIINQLALKIKKNPLFSEGNFILDNPITYLKNKMIQD